MTSEEKLGISKPPDFTCPQIDKGVKSIRDGLLSLKFALKAQSESNMRDEVESAEWAISDIEDILEHCRSQLEDIRSWGQQWKDMAKAMIEEHDPQLLYEEDK